VSGKGCHCLPRRQNGEGPGLTVGPGGCSDTDLYEVFEHGPVYGLIGKAAAGPARCHKLYQGGCIEFSGRKPRFLLAERLIP